MESWNDFMQRLKRNREKLIAQCADAKARAHLEEQHQAWENTEPALRIVVDNVRRSA